MYRHLETVGEDVVDIIVLLGWKIWGNIHTYIHTWCSVFLKTSYSNSYKYSQLLCNSKVYHHANKRTIILCLESVQTFPIFTTYLYKFRFNIILPSTSKSSTWLLSFGLRIQKPVCISHSPHVLHVPLTSNSLNFNA
jgi:hypothetical protein